MNKLISAFLHMPVRNFVAYVGMALSGIFILYFFLQIPNSAKAKTENALHAMGFKSVEIKGFHTSFNGFSSDKVLLDLYGFDGIKSIRVKLNWISFLTVGKIESVTIDGIHISRNTKSDSMLPPNLLTGILKLPDFRLQLENIIYDLGTSFGDIRVTGQVGIQNANDGHTINAIFSSSQYQLGFESKWQGKVSANNVLDLYGEFLEGRFNVGSIKISRFDGWASISNGEKGTQAQISLNAGSALFKKIPLQSISLSGNYANNNALLTARSGISGFPDALISIDFAKENSHESSSIAFETKNLGKILEANNTSNKAKIPDALKSIKDFFFFAELQPERQFKGGPLAYTLTLKANDKNMNGNILIYQNSWDARGSLELNPDYIRAIKDYLNVPQSNVSKDFLRLDGSLKSLLF